MSRLTYLAAPTDDVMACEAVEDFGKRNGGGGLTEILGGKTGCGESGTRSVEKSGFVTNGFVERFPAMLYGQKWPVPFMMDLTTDVDTDREDDNEQFVTSP